MALIEDIYQLPNLIDTWRYFANLSGTQADHFIHDGSVTGRAMYWVPYSGSTPGRFVTDSYTAANTYRQSYYATDTVGVTNAPISLVCAELNPQILNNNWLDSVGIDAPGVAYSILNAWTQAVADLCGGSAAVATGADGFMLGNTEPFLAVMWATAYATNQFSWFSQQAYNTKYITSPPGTFTPAGIRAGPAVQQALVIVQQPAANNPIPDLEIAINNGGSIYSISSNTFTEP